MDLSIITPSLNQPDRLACCIASVADQAGVEVEHIVQDAGTRDFQKFAEGMAQRWPNRTGYRRIMASEHDQGMYDAVNRGLRKSEGKICAYLNCDEQLLPGALAKVKSFFADHDRVDILFGGFLVLDEQGRLVTAQKPVPLSSFHLMTSHLPNFSCATFFRRNLLENPSAWFDAELRDCGDAWWNLQRIQEGVKSARSPAYFSVFTETGSNRGLHAQAKREREVLRGMAPAWVRQTDFLWKTIHRWRKLWAGGYLPQRIGYQIWCLGQDEKQRKHYGPTWATGIWRSRLGL
jgi:glycosyltransferase involved in cell wall biosynthesis